MSRAGRRRRSARRPCQRVGCGKRATHAVIFEFRVEADGPAAVSAPVLHLCRECGDEVNEDDWLNSEGWAQICNGFREAGVAEPAREHSNVSLVALN